MQTFEKNLHTETMDGSYLNNQSPSPEAKQDHKTLLLNKVISASSSNYKIGKAPSAQSIGSKKYSRQEVCETLSNGRKIMQKLQNEK